MHLNQAKPFVVYLVFFTLWVGRRILRGDAMTSSVAYMVACGFVAAACATIYCRNHPARQHWPAAIFYFFISLIVVVGLLFISLFAVGYLRNAIAF